MKKLLNIKVEWKFYCPRCKNRIHENDFSIHYCYCPFCTVKKFEGFNYRKLGLEIIKIPIVYVNNENLIKRLKDNYFSYQDTKSIFYSEDIHRLIKELEELNDNSKKTSRHKV